MTFAVPVTFAARALLLLVLVPGRAPRRRASRLGATFAARALLLLVLVPCRAPRRQALRLAAMFAARALPLPIPRRLALRLAATFAKEVSLLRPTVIAHVVETDADKRKRIETTKGRSPISPLVEPAVYAAVVAAMRDLEVLTKASKA